MFWVEERLLEVLEKMQEQTICKMRKALEAQGVDRKRMPTLIGSLTPNDMDILPLGKPLLYFFPEPLPGGNFTFHVTIKYHALSSAIKINADAAIKINVDAIHSLPTRLDPSRSYFIAHVSQVTNTEDRIEYVLPESLNFRYRGEPVPNATPSLSEHNHQAKEILIPLPGMPTDALLLTGHPDRVIVDTETGTYKERLSIDTETSAHKEKLNKAPLTYP